MTGGGGHEALDFDLVFSVLENIVWGGQVLRVLPTDISSRLSRTLSATISTLHTGHGSVLYIGYLIGFLLLVEFFQLGIRD